jgi:hypothetical protein
MLKSSNHEVVIKPRLVKQRVLDLKDIHVLAMVGARNETTFQSLLVEYNNLDRSFLKLQGGSEEIMTTHYFVFGNNIYKNAFKDFCKRIERDDNLPKSYMLYFEGKVFVYELPLKAYESSLRYFTTLLDKFVNDNDKSYVVMRRSTHQILGDEREADIGLVLKFLLHSHMQRLPAFIVKFGWLQTIEDLDEAAQFWLRSCSVRGVLVFKLFKRRDDGTSAMFAAFYEQGKVRSGGGFAPKWATSFGTAAVLKTCLPDLGTIVTEPLDGGPEAGNHDEAFLKTISGASLFFGPGSAGKDFTFDLRDLRCQFNEYV